MYQTPPEDDYSWLKNNITGMGLINVNDEKAGEEYIETFSKVSATEPLNISHNRMQSDVDTLISFLKKEKIKYTTGSKLLELSSTNEDLSPVMVKAVKDARDKGKNKQFGPDNDFILFNLHPDLGAQLFSNIQTINDLNLSIQIKNDDSKNIFELKLVEKKFYIKATFSEEHKEFLKSFAAKNSTTVRFFDVKESPTITIVINKEIESVVSEFIEKFPASEKSSLRTKVVFNH